MTNTDIEERLIKLSKKELIEYAMANNHIPRERRCQTGTHFLQFVSYKKSLVNGFAWRCMTCGCEQHKKYFSLRGNTFFKIISFH
jgi:hypothetical protein